MGDSRDSQDLCHHHPTAASPNDVWGKGHNKLKAMAVSDKEATGSLATLRETCRRRRQFGRHQC